MKSKWYRLKPRAIKLRKRGLSIGKIEYRLGIPRSTLSGWFKSVTLAPEQKKKLFQDWKNALVKARKKAVLWHNAQKEKRLQEARGKALTVLKNIDLHDHNILELALAILYFGEGSRKKIEAAMGNSDPLVLNFFLSILRKIYNIDNTGITCQLHLRADQDPRKVKLFWARELKLPLRCFKHISIDKRTMGSKTYPSYKGVCEVRCRASAAVQRKLVYLSEFFFKSVID